MAQITDLKSSETGFINNPELSTAGSCYEWLKRQIVTNNLSPGTGIDERQLAEQLGVSRTPVREAMLRLRTEGFIENLPRRGAFVRSLSVDDLRNIYDVVTGLEVMAVGLIAEADDRTDTVVTLYDLCDHLESALHEPENWTHTDEIFHRRLLELSGNRYLAQTGLLHRELAQRAHFVADRARPKGTEKRSMQAHRELVDHIAKGHSKKARENHFDQRQRGSASLLSAIKALDLKTL